jgi:adenosylhomocysteine nucleosidase
MALASGSILILISANAEWLGVKDDFPQAAYQPSLYGEWFQHTFSRPHGDRTAIFFHGGWGKIAAAASTEYAIQRWQPGLVVNLGTCGGFAGQVERGQVLLVEETIVYDIIEQMSDPAEALDHYTTRLDLSWLPQPLPGSVIRARLVSADRDILPQDIPYLSEHFGACAADWESGAIAWVTARHGLRCLILRGVTDLVGTTGGEAYGNIELFHEQARKMMRTLVNILEEWII